MKIEELDACYCSFPAETLMENPNTGKSELPLLID